MNTAYAPEARSGMKDRAFPGSMYVLVVHRDRLAHLPWCRGDVAYLLR